ncbi:hypothetical protein FA95DRAFT_1610104 [Auriscalpium vulgare]|uniref:Uncharacterized protein n=1 Tax=Auriscalpium vulgare TaxID=40419 RepID=A0ACB8RG50_9AGAM|nr:hypothetical protein FA95DRAFT_1610104 [Auriscalpium vulgare]
MDAFEDEEIIAMATRVAEGVFRFHANENNVTGLDKRIHEKEYLAVFFKAMSLEPPPEDLSSNGKLARSIAAAVQQLRLHWQLSPSTQTWQSMHTFLGLKELKLEGHTEWYPIRLLLVLSCLPGLRSLSVCDITLVPPTEYEDWYPVKLPMLRILRIKGLTTTINILLTYLNMPALTSRSITIELRRYLFESKTITPLQEVLKKAIHGQLALAPLTVSQSAVGVTCTLSGSIEPDKDDKFEFKLFWAAEDDKFMRAHVLNVLQGVTTEPNDSKHTEEWMKLLEDGL